MADWPRRVIVPTTPVPSLDGRGAQNGIIWMCFVIFGQNLDVVAAKSAAAYHCPNFRSILVLVASTLCYPLLLASCYRLLPDMLAVGCRPGS